MKIIEERKGTIPKRWKKKNFIESHRIAHGRSPREKKRKRTTATRHEAQKNGISGEAENTRGRPKGAPEISLLAKEGPDEKEKNIRTFRSWSFFKREL